MLKEMKQESIKQSIVTETKKQFLEKGILKTTLRGIAKELGIAFGNIYYYYKSKADICGVLWQNYTNEYIDIFEKRLNKSELKDKSGLEKLRVYYLHLFDYFQQNPLYAELIAFSMTERPVNFKTSLEIKDTSRKAKSRIQNTLVKLYEEGITDSSIKAEIPNVWYEAWSFNISYVTIIVNVIRYRDIGEDVYEYYVNTYLNRLALRSAE